MEGKQGEESVVNGGRGDGEGEVKEDKEE